MKLEETVDYHIKTTWHALARMYNQLAGDFEMSQTIGYVLINISKEGTPATKIAPLMGMEPTSLSRLLKNMEDKGYIYRRGDETDKRIVRIYLTPQGLEKKKIARDTILKFNEKVLSTIKERELEILVKVLEQISSLTKDFKAEN